IQFGPLGIALGVIGVWQGSLKSSLPTRKIISFFIIYALFGIYYRVSDQFTFFITSYIFWALMMGVGMHYLLIKLRESVSRIMVGIVSALLIATPFFYIALPRLATSANVDDTTIGIPQIGTGLRDGLAYY